MPYPTWSDCVSQSPEEWKHLVEGMFRMETDGPTVVSRREYADLRALAHNCFFRHSLANGIPIILRDDLAQREWCYKTAPERLEVSMEIWESIKAIKSPFEWHEFEDALWSTQ